MYELLIIKDYTLFIVTFTIFLNNTIFANLRKPQLTEKENAYLIYQYLLGLRY